jgi:hypothetical protein
MKEFAHIKKNIYIDRKKYAFSDDEAYICSCEKHPIKTHEIKEMEIPFDQKKEDDIFGCGKSCLNKMVSWECVEHLCPAGISCRNRRFQQHLYEEVYPIKTDSRGWGLCAGIFLPKGTFVMQYIGEIYSIDSQYGQGKLKEYRNKTCTYLMSISKNEVIDPTYKGNLARFINHSCEPNCETQKWHVLGEICVGIFTLRDIQEGEELTFNYGFDILKTTFQKCLCGAKNCKGYLGIVTNNEPSKGLSNSIVCDVCKNGCRGKETIVVCEMCKKIFHKNCVKRTKERKILESIKNYDPATNNYLCNSCIKRKDRDSSVINIGSYLNLTPLSNTKKDSNSNIINSLNNLTISASQSSEMKDKYKDKKSSQELISELKRKKLRKGVLPTGSRTSLNQDISVINPNQNVIHEECESNEESSEVAITNKESLLDTGLVLNTNKIETSINSNLNNNYNLNENSSVAASSNKLKTVKTYEEEEIIDDSIEVSEIGIKKIQSSLKTLSNIGARLFWDFRQLSNINLNNLIEVKITGTPSQIEKVKVEINKIIAEKEVTLDSYSVQINVPKLFVRRIIGHQNRNLISYKSKFNVDMDFDSSLITDDIFQIGENSKITIKGKENFVKFVEKEIKKHLFNLKVLTIFLMPTDYNYVRNNICQLKTMVDPADLRLRKRDYKLDRDIKHSFYYVPSNNKDLVVIGYDSEIKKAEKIIKEFLLRQNTLNFNYSLCVLCPLYYSKLIDNFRNDNSNLINKKNLILKVFDPVFSRKHLNIYLEGKWKDIVEIKEMLFKYLSEKEKNKNRAKSNIAEFKQYAFNQEHKLISKNLRKFFLESNYQVKNWDLITEDIWQTLEGNKSQAIQKKEEDDYNKLIKEFTKYSDRDTTMNYLLHLPSGAYESVFSMSKLELTRSLIDYVGDNLESYQSSFKDRSDKRERSEIKSESAVRFENETINLKKCVIENEISKRDNEITNNHDINSNMMVIDSELIENFSEDESQKEAFINLEKQDMKSFVEKNNLIVNKNSEILVEKPVDNVIISTISNSMSDMTNNINAKGFMLSMVNPISTKETLAMPNTNIPITLPAVQEEKCTNTLQLDKNITTKINNQIQSNSTTISALDNIQSTLLNKLNEIRNENKLNNMEHTNINSNNSVESNESAKTMNVSGILPNYGIVVTPDDLNILKSLKSTQIPTINSTNTSINPSEMMNISYNFSNINQMNININISSIKDLINESNLNSQININQNNADNIFQNNEIGHSSKDNERESVMCIDENTSKYDKYSDKYNDKYSDRNRDKDQQFLKRKFKANQPLDYVNRERPHNYYHKAYEKERDREKDRERSSTNLNCEYGYYNSRTDGNNSSKYANNRKYYTNSSNFSNYNYNKTKRNNYNNASDNFKKSYYRSNNYSYKREPPRFSRSNSHSDGLISRSVSRSPSYSKNVNDDNSDSYYLKNENSKYTNKKRNINSSINQVDHDISTKNKKEINKSSSVSHSQSRSDTNSLRSRSSQSSSSFSNSSSPSFKRDIIQNSNKFTNRSRNNAYNNNYKQNAYTRRIHYTNSNKPNFKQNFYSNNTNNQEHNSLQSNYNQTHYQSNSNKFHYDNKPHTRSAYYKPNNMHKIYYNSGGKYYNNYYSNRYNNRYIRRSRSNSGSPSKDKYKEFLRLKKKESESFVENRENVTETECTNYINEQVIQLKSCVKKPSSFN